MPIFIARLYRVVPLIVVLLVVAVVVFALVCTTRNATRAKEVLLRLFWWISAVGCLFFALATAYAAFDKTQLGIELFGSCLVIMVVAWGIDVVCGLVFRRHHPTYKIRPTLPKPKAK